MYQGQMYAVELQPQTSQKVLSSKISVEALYGFDPDLIDSLGGNDPLCVITHPEATFFVRFSDENLLTRGILIIDRAAVVTHNAQVLILHNGDFKLAYARVKHSEVLFYDAPSWQPLSRMIGQDPESVEVWGVVLVKNYSR